MNSDLVSKIFDVSGVNSVDLSESSVTNIPAITFLSNEKINSITVRDNTTIKFGAFCDCTNLITVNGTLTSVGNNAFEGCTSLTSIAVNGEVGKAAFYDCSNLQNLWLGENFSIAEGANPFSGAFSSVSKLHVHYSGPESETIKSIFGNLGIDVDYHWGCNGSDRAPTPALNSGLASLLLGL